MASNVNSIRVELRNALGWDEQLECGDDVQEGGRCTDLSLGHSDEALVPATDSLDSGSETWESLTNMNNLGSEGLATPGLANGGEVGSLSQDCIPRELFPPNSAKAHSLDGGVQELPHSGVSASLHIGNCDQTSRRFSGPANRAHDRDHGFGKENVGKAAEDLAPQLNPCIRVESWVCAICHNAIPLAEASQVKGCEHPYCANCILQWCSYKTYPWCPQCRTPFDSLLLFKLLDGSLSDAMVEESVCLLLRAPWYVPVEIVEEVDNEEEFPCDDEDYDEDEYYRSNLRIGNRRWGQNGYVSGGRMQARVTIPTEPSTQVHAGRRASGGGAAQAGASGSASSAPAKASSSKGGGLGRRAKRAQKREQADKAEAAPTSRHLGTSLERSSGRVT